MGNVIVILVIQAYIYDFELGPPSSVLVVTVLELKLM